MQNPFRHMGPDDHRPRDAEDDISWNVDRTHDRHPGAARSADDRDRYEDRVASEDRGWPQPRGVLREPGRSDRYDQQHRASREWDGGTDRERGRGGAWGAEHAPSWERERAQSWNQGRPEGYAGPEHARGSNMNRPGPHDFDPDYLHWREQQISTLDKDYADWRTERRQKFSTDFDSWRQNRAGGPRIEAENPIVGNVADGGDGRGGEESGRKR